MDLIIVNNCYVFNDISKSVNDFTIELNEKLIKVHKRLLTNESDYFTAMFENQWIETNNNYLKLQELVKPFLTVIKLVYDLYPKECKTISNQSISKQLLNELNGLKIPEINESIIISNKYQFRRIEKFLSEKLMQKFPPMTDQNQYLCLDIFDVYEMSKLHELKHLIDGCLEYFDENSTQILEVMNEKYINQELIIEIISRESFGVNEMDLFSTVIKLIKKSRLNCGNQYYAYEQSLLDAIRFESIPKPMIESDVKTELIGLLVNIKGYDYCLTDINNEVNDMLSRDRNKAVRYLIRPEMDFTAKVCLEKGLSDRRTQAFLSSNIAFSVDLNNLLVTADEVYVFGVKLNTDTKLNDICFETEKHLKNCWIEYKITDKDSNIKWQSVVQHSNYHLNGHQFIHFDDIITNKIRINCRTTDKILRIDSIVYKFTKNDFKTESMNNMFKSFNV